MVRALIDMGASLHAVDEYGRSALHFAVRRGHVGAVGVLLKLGAKVNLQAHPAFGRREAALHLAVRHAYLASIRLLIQVPLPTPLSSLVSCVCVQRRATSVQASILSVTSLSPRHLSASLSDTWLNFLFGILTR